VKSGQESQTAIMVAVGRAIADGRTKAAAFHDPTAYALLPAGAQREVAAIRAGTRGATVGIRISRVLAERRSEMMVPRTVAIDAAVRQAAAPQVVILGAGLDGRAWRMDELASATVFEVDHPDSQRTKRERSARLPLKAREVRFVPVDFDRDDLDAALGAAGHNPHLRTIWIWEGVVMYLARPAIAATLAIVARRSPPGSRLVVAYHAPALILKLVGWIVGRAGEPLRSAFRPQEMRQLLARHGFAVVRDDDLPTLAQTVTPEVAAAVRPLRHFRIVVAERVT